MDAAISANSIADISSSVLDVGEGLQIALLMCK